MVFQWRRSVCGADPGYVPRMRSRSFSPLLLTIVDQILGHPRSRNKTNPSKSQCSGAVDMIVGLEGSWAHQRRSIVYEEAEEVSAPFKLKWSAQVLATRPSFSLLLPRGFTSSYFSGWQDLATGLAYPKRPWGKPGAQNACTKSTIAFLSVGRSFILRDRPRRPMVSAFRLPSTYIPWGDALHSLDPLLLWRHG